MMCRHVGCSKEATASIDAEGANGLLVDSADVCQEHRESFMEGWTRMQQDAGALRDQGLPSAEVSRIMCERVDRGDY